MDATCTYLFGSEVYASDADCGELRQVMVEPALPRVTDLVAFSIAEGVVRLVPITLARSSELGVLVDCERDQLVSRPPAAMAEPSGTAVAVGRGELVRRRDGPDGHVEGFVVYRDDGEITQVLVAAGPWWRRRHLAIPVEQVLALG
ncbi:MAG: hypothetical protein HOV83_08380 [Catenulispora sp.]|nr:hypothetical protein [Catenulispora sp.]